MIQPSDRYVELINTEFMPLATAEAAYCLGVISVLAWQSGLEPDRGLVSLLVGCSSISVAIEIFEAWTKRKRKRRKHAGPPVKLGKN